MFDSLRPHELQHARSPCPSPTPRVRSDSRPLSQWCHPAISSSVVSFSSYPPSIRVFSNESTLHMRWPKYWSFSFSHHSFQRNPRADLLQNGLVGSPCSPRDSQKSLLQHHSAKVSILRHSAFFTVQLSHPYITTGKTIALTRWTLVSKVISPLLNMLSRLVKIFLPRSKCLFISWLQSPSAVNLKPHKKSLTLFPHLFAMKWWDWMPWLTFLNAEL